MTLNTNGTTNAQVRNYEVDVYDKESDPEVGDRIRFYFNQTYNYGDVVDVEYGCFIKGWSVNKFDQKVVVEPENNWRRGCNDKVVLYNSEEEDRYQINPEYGIDQITPENRGWLEVLDTLNIDIQNKDLEYDLDDDIISVKGIDQKTYNKLTSQSVGELISKLFVDDHQTNRFSLPSELKHTNTLEYELVNCWKEFVDDVKVSYCIEREISEDEEKHPDLDEQFNEIIDMAVRYNVTVKPFDCGVENRCDISIAFRNTGESDTRFTVGYDQDDEIYYVFVDSCGRCEYESFDNFQEYVRELLKV